MRRFYFETFLISLAVILLEISYTRVFSFKLVYYFTYLVIGISLLGLGAGGVFVAVFERLRRMEPSRLISTCCLVAGGGVALGYVVVALVPLNLFQMMIHAARGTRADFVSVGFEGAKLALVLVALFLPFLSAGIALATIFATQTERISRLYAVDLLGAAFGCALVVPALVYLSPPGVVFLAGLSFALAGGRLARNIGPAWMTAAVVLTAVLLVGVLLPTSLPDPVPDDVKSDHDPEAVLFSRWSPVFRVDVVPAVGAEPPIHLLVHDGTFGSSIMAYDGDLASLERYETSDRSYPFRLLPPGPQVAIVGSAGGNEILASLRLGAEHVTGIELNPVTVSLLTDHFADFTGHLTDDPRVEVVNAEGRSYLESADRTFDLVWLVAPDSYAAMNAASSGAFVLSESYLYTQEMIETALRHLGDDGILCAQFGEIDFDIKPNRVLRYLGTAREAFRQLGIDDFSRHVYVAVAPGFGRLNSSTILLKKSPFGPQDAAAFEAATATIPGAKIVYPPLENAAASRIAPTIELEGQARDDFYRDLPYLVRPITDDSPFFWHFVGFGDALLGGERHDFNVEEGVGERLLLLFLVSAVVFGAAFLLLPLVVIRDTWRQVPYKWSAGVYFAALGLGFMFIEVALIQKLTLFLGYPTYSLTVTLFALLSSTGLGSLLSERLVGRRNAAFAFLLSVLAVLVLVYHVGLSALLAAAVGWPLAIRVILTIACLAPLGVCLGCFMPLGLRTVSQVGPQGEAYVAWCWAVNGFFSVVASVLSTVLSMTIGFQLVMYTGLIIYLLGTAAFLRLPPPRTA